MLSTLAYRQFTASPTEFLLTPYCAGLLVMFGLLRVIQQKITRQPHRSTLPQAVAHSLQLWFRETLLSTLDFQKTSIRLAFQLPIICALLKVVLLWLILVLRTFESPHPRSVSPDFSLSRSAGLLPLEWLDVIYRRWLEKDVGQICWYTFCATCASYALEAFIKRRTGDDTPEWIMPAGMVIFGRPSITSPLQMPSYAFALYSASVATISSTNSGVSGTSPSPKPHREIVISIFLFALSRFFLHLLFVSERLSRHRLFPTGLRDLLTIAFCCEAVLTSRPGYTGSGVLPALTMMGLLTFVVFTKTLNFTAQLLVQGYAGEDEYMTPVSMAESVPGITRGGIGLIRRISTVLSSLPTEEEFVVLLTQLAKDSLLSTGMTGWGNEVAPIFSPVGIWRHMTEGYQLQDAIAQTRATEASSKSQNGTPSSSRLIKAVPIFPITAPTRGFKESTEEGSSKGYRDAYVFEGLSSLLGRVEPKAEVPGPCAICLTSPREIICWPCRCLVTCNACRAHLAFNSSRAPLCLFCQKRIEGFSRIFIH